MKAAVFQGVGEAMRVEELARPEPRAGEVLVRVRACGVCHTDLHVIKGEVSFPTPCVLGHEISGTIVALGPGVGDAGADGAGLAIGRRVVGGFIMPCGTCWYCVRGQDGLCETFFVLNRLQGKLFDGDTRLRRADGSPVWMYSMGGLAEYAVVPATGVAPLPDDVALEEAAILGCAIFTAYGAIRNGADLRAGESVAVVATGGVGSNLLQLAQAFGAGPIVAIDVRDDKLRAARDLGATHTINSAAEDAAARVREITGGRGVDVAFEALGRPETFVLAASIVRAGGRAVMVGIAPAGTTAAVEITPLVRRGVSIVGSYGARPRADLPAVIELARRGAVDVTRAVTRRYELDRAAEAYDALNRGEIVGRAIVTMPD
ncbi:MAG: zinc-binding dehydrogenase [Chloroflexota bacterium]|nr:zinc-binding dehydrogenase [Chloroflexota bacterium]